MPVTNAVPAVVAAPPGIVTLADLPPITGRIAPAV
jgi:4-hydroxy-tetrahydrodipicolinate reductase